MLKNILLSVLFLLGALFIFDTGSGSILDAQVITNCDGTRVIRVGVGRFEVQKVAPNTFGCIDTTPKGSVTNYISSNFTGTITPITIAPPVINCNGNVVTQNPDGSYTLSHTGTRLPGCIAQGSSQVGTAPEPVEMTGTTSQIDLSHGPLLDLRSTQIADYRKKLLEDQNVQFANPVRSVRIRAAATKNSETEAILMKNDAVVNSGDGNGWDAVQGADLVVTNETENTVVADTEGKADGYTAARYLRDPTNTDLVRIGQADFAYWSDVAHVNVDHLVNVRLHPW